MRKLTNLLYLGFLANEAKGIRVVGGVSHEKAKRLAKAIVDNSNSAKSLSLPDIATVPNANANYKENRGLGLYEARQMFSSKGPLEARRVINALQKTTN